MEGWGSGGRLRHCPPGWEQPTLAPAGHYSSSGWTQRSSERTGAAGAAEERAGRCLRGFWLLTSPIFCTDPPPGRCCYSHCGALSLDRVDLGR